MVEVRWAIRIVVRSAMKSRTRLRNLLLRMRIDVRQGVVQDDDRRRLEQRACQGGALLLPARQRDAALAQNRLEAVSELSEVVGQPDVSKA